MIRTRALVALAALVAAVLLGGCLTVGMGVDATVASDATIERYEIQMNLSGQGYTMMRGLGSMGEGNDSGGLGDVERELEENVSEEFRSVGDVETNVTETAERMSITVVLHDAVPRDGGNLTVATEGDRIVYRDAILDRSFGDVGPSMSGMGGASDGTDGDSGGSTDGTDAMEGTGGMGGMMEDVPEPELHLTYRLEMPGAIQDSNADSVEGNVARWNRSYNGSEMEDAGFVARANASTGGGGLPGFGAAVAAIAVVLAGLAAGHRRR